jgi:phosphate transporter
MSLSLSPDNVSKINIFFYVLLPYPRFLKVMVLGSFSLAAALSKLRLDRAFAVFLLSIVKGGRALTIFAFMILGWLMSMCVGNVAASVLCMSMAGPILEELPERSRETPM